MQKSAIADNPQARPVSDIDLGYVAGLLDGEGSIFVKGWIQRKSAIRIEPQISLVANTNKAMMERAKDIYERLGLAFCVEEKHLKRKTSGGTMYQPVWQLKVRGLKRCKRALEVLSPYITAKTAQAKMLLAWCNRRLELPQKGGLHWKYTEDDLKFAQAIKNLNATRPKYSLSRLTDKLESPNDYTLGAATCAVKI
jgi:hypothetical protein